MKLYVSRVLALLLCVLLLVGCTAEPPVQTETQTETETPVKPAPMTATPPEPVYLPVENGDFETAGEDGLVGWGDLAGKLDPGDGTAVISSEVAYSGSNSLQIQDPGVSDVVTLYNAGSLGVVEGYAYTARAMFFSESDSADVMIRLDFFNMYGKACGEYKGETVYDQVGQWQQLQVTGTAPTGAVMARVHLVSKSMDACDVYVDDVTLEQLPLLEPLGDGWTVEGGSVDSGVLTLDSGSAVSAPAAAIAGVTYTLTGQWETEAALHFYDAQGELLLQAASGAYAPAEAAAVTVELTGSGRAANLALVPGFFGTQAVDGSFEALAGGTSAWSGEGFESSTDLVTDGAVGVKLTEGTLVSNWIPATSGKDYILLADARGDVTMELGHYRMNANVGNGLYRAETQGDGVEQLEISSQAQLHTFAIRVVLKSGSEGWVDNVRLYAVTDSVSNASFEDTAHTYAGSHALHWQSFGGAAVSLHGAKDLPDGALAIRLDGLAQPGGVRSSLIRVAEGDAYTARIMACGQGGLRLAFYDEMANRLSEGDLTAISGEGWSKYAASAQVPAGAAYAVVEILADAGSTVLADAVEFGTAVVDVQDNVQLFIDDYLIDGTDLTRTFHEGEKGEPIFSPDPENAWQSGGAYLYGTVLYDEQDQLYKMWYQTNNTAGVEFNDSAQVMAAYATSVDGVNWDIPVQQVQDAFAAAPGKTTFDTVSFVETSKDSNGLNKYENFTIEGSNIIGNFHILNVFLDEEAEPNERFKMVTYRHSKRYYATLTSADGIIWNWDGSLLKPTGGSDVITVAWDEENQKYFSLLKIRTNDKRDQYTMVSDGSDLTSFGTPVVSNSLGDLLDTMTCYRADCYGMGLQARDGVYIGMNWLFYIPGTNQMEGVFDVQLTFSRDLTEDWQRPTRTAVIPRGEDGAIDDGLICTASMPVVMGDEVWWYTGVWDGDHGISERVCYLYITKWRLDGYASLDGTGTLTTKPMTFTGSTLELNANAEGGKLLVELLDAEGQPIAGFTRDDCDPITTDDVRHTVTWNGSADVSALAGQTVILQIIAENGQVYSLQFCE